MRQDTSVTIAADRAERNHGKRMGPLPDFLRHNEKAEGNGRQPTKEVCER